MDDTRRTITVRNDEFGSWFEHIDHNPQSYVGYRIRITGFVSKPSTLGTDEFQISRQFMSCCILDMTPFGFTAVTAKAAKLHEYDWVTIDATIEQGTYGTSGHERQGLILQVSSLRQAANAPTGYFYWQ
ncbi:MAG: TIGR03943 family putative permease subunit [Bifidobacterium dentium]